MSSESPVAVPATHASVSVIVPGCNRGRFIAQAIDSILGQTLQPEQIIIVDDGSTDDTEQVVRRYRDARIEYIKQQHAGVASARNTGLNAARCDFVTFLDADDRWRPTFIERMHGFVAEDPTVACAFANFVRFQDTTGEVSRDQFQNYPELRRPVLLRDMPNAHGRIPREKAFSALVACGEIPAHLQVMIFRRSLIDSIRFEAPGADTRFALQTFLRGGVIFTDEVLAEVRRLDNEATREDAETAVHKLDGLKALAPHVTRGVDLAAYHDRLVRAHLDTALSQARSGRVRAGLHHYREGLRLPGSRMRKIKGSVRLALVLPKALAR
jgi:glycosyltransferase involved in cell wall biosynthesis